jgi:hypothetical protein
MFCLIIKQHKDIIIFKIIIKMIININILFFLFIYFLSTNSLYLSKNQLTQINNLIINPSLTVNQRNKINMILLDAYYFFALKKTMDFRKLHYHKCKGIPIIELNLCANIGLFKAIQNYNGKYCLDNYASLYIKGELFKCITQKYSLSPLPNKLLKANRTNLTYNERKQIKHLMEVSFVNDNSLWKIEKHISKNNVNIIEQICEREKHEYLLWKINKLLDNPFKKRVFYLKYDTNFNIIRSNKKISELMCCSEEYIRKTIEQIKCQLIASNLFIKSDIYVSI